MENLSNISGNLGISRLWRYLPEPASSIAGTFSDIFQRITQSAAPIQGTGTDGQLASLMAEQLAQQEKMQAISLFSNVAKAEHECQMAPIRNIRVG